MRLLAFILLLVGAEVFAGDFRVHGSIAGRVENDGTVRVGGSIAGKLESGGDIRVRGSIIGRIESNGDVRDHGSIVGRAEGLTKEQAAVLFFFEFFDVR